MTTGVLVSYDAVKGFGFIRPDSGGTDVVIHVNDFDFAGSDVDVGMRCEFDTEDRDGGVWASNVRLLDHVPSRQAAEPREMSDPRSLGQRVHSDDYRVELTELLLAEAAWLTGKQLVMVRQVVMGSVESHGWLIDEPFPEQVVV